MPTTPSREALRHGAGTSAGKADTWSPALLLAFGLWFVGMAVVLSWPMIREPGQAALGYPGADTLKHLWNLWWMRASVWQMGSFPFHTHLVNFPTGMDLYPIEPLNGLVAVLLPGVDLVILSNLLSFGNIVLTGVAGAWLGFVLSGRRAGAFVCGTILEGSAVVAFFVHVGVGELQHLWWLPLGLGVLVRARTTMKWRWFFALALALIGAVLSCFYLGLYLAMGTALWAVFTLGSPRQAGPLLARYAVSAGLALAVVLPITHTFSSSYVSQNEPTGDPGASASLVPSQPPPDPPSTRLEPAQVLIPPAPPATDLEHAYGGGRYLGWTFLGFALVGTLRRPKQALPWLTVACVGYVLALGSYLAMDGAAVTRADGATYRLPAFYFNDFLGMVAEPINFPVRFLALTTVAGAAAASLAVRRWGALLAVGAALEVGMLQRVDWPWARSTLTPMAELLPLAERHVGEGVVDLDLMLRPDVAVRRSSIAAQLQLDHPINLMPIERMEFFAREGRFVVESLPIYGRLYQACARRPVVIPKNAAAASRELLREARLRLVLVHRGCNAAQTMTDALTQAFGEAVVQGPTASVWRVADLDPGEVVDPVLMKAARTQARALQEHGQQIGRPLR